MEQDFDRLLSLRSELRSLRRICKNEFVLRSIDDVIEDIRLRLESLGDIGAQPSQSSKISPLR